MTIACRAALLRLQRRRQRRVNSSWQLFDFASVARQPAGTPASTAAKGRVHFQFLGLHLHMCHCLLACRRRTCHHHRHHWTRLSRFSRELWLSSPWLLRTALSSNHYNFSDIFTSFQDPAAAVPEVPKAKARKFIVDPKSRKIDLCACFAAGACHYTKRTTTGPSWIS